MAKLYDINDYEPRAPIGPPEHEKGVRRPPCKVYTFPPQRARRSLALVPRPEPDPKDCA